MRYCLNTITGIHSTIPFYAILVAMIALGELPCVQAADQWLPVPIITQGMRDRGVDTGGEGAQWPRSIVWSAASPQFALFSTDVGGIYRTLDAGGHWQVCMVGWYARGGNGFAIDPKNGNRVIGIGGNSTGSGVVDTNGLYVSTDQAASWHQTKAMKDPEGGSVAYDPSSYDAGVGYCRVAYYASPASGIFRSGDGGETWAQVNTALSGTRIAVHPSKGFVYVTSNNSTDYGFWKSTDGGVSFTNISANYTLGLCVIPSQPDTVYISRWDKVQKSTDSGQTFSYVGTDFANDGLPTNAPIENITVSAVNPQNMACWYRGDNWAWKRYYSTDGGAHWQESAFDNQNQSLPYNVRDGLFAWSPTDAAVLLSVGGDWITKSTDGGAHLRWSSNGENAVMVGGGFSFSPTTPDAVCLSFQDYNGAHSADGGRTWTYRDISGNGWGGFSYGGYALDAQVMWVGNADSWGGTRKLTLSRDGGATWTVQKDAANADITFSGLDIGYSAPDDSTILFASNWRSIDKGLHWLAMSECDGVLTANPNGSHELYGKKGNDVVRSDDRGATWTTVGTVTNGFSDVAVDAAHARIYVASEDQVKLHTASGWSTLSLPRDHYNATRYTSVAIDPVDPAIIYASGHKDIYACDNAVVRSSDSGATWTNLTVTMPLSTSVSGGPHEVGWIRVHPRTRELWAAGQCYGMWRIPAPGVAVTNPPATVPPATTPPATTLPPTTTPPTTTPPTSMTPPANPPPVNGGGTVSSTGSQSATKKRCGAGAGAAALVGLMLIGWHLRR